MISILWIFDTEEKIPNPNTTKIKGILQNPKSKKKFKHLFVVFEFWIAFGVRIPDIITF